MAVAPFVLEQGRGEELDIIPERKSHGAGVCVLCVVPVLSGKWALFGSLFYTEGHFAG